MTMDFNGADPQMSDLIPAGTIAPVCMTIRTDKATVDGWFVASLSSDAIYLDCEFTVTEGRHARRKFWQNFVFRGGKTNEKNQSIAGEISRSTFRAMVESARGIKPNDESEQARAGRRVEMDQLNGMVFLCKIGVEKDKSGQYPDKNKVLGVITPDKKEYGNGPINWNGFDKQTAPAGAPAHAAQPWMQDQGSGSAPTQSAPWTGNQPANPAPAATVPPTEAPPQGQPTPPPPQGQQAQPPAPPASPAQAGAPGWATTPPPNHAPKG